jgi:nicotinate-nucleotide pyrophosphorylase (carboxylating)
MRPSRTVLLARSRRASPGSWPVPYTAFVTPVESPQRTEADLERLISAALTEDLGPGDVTTEALILPTARARARLVAKADGVLAGREAFLGVFQHLDPELTIVSCAADGDAVVRGDVVAELEGRARALLSGERTALNLVQHLSGIATLTARFVAAARPARVLDTRKTVPGLRTLEKHAVTCGGGHNHRFGLFDQAMVKNNHLDLAGRPLAALLASLRARHGSGLCITVEARDEREALDGVAADADVVLLDNFSPAQLRSLCPVLRRAASGRSRTLVLEASGGITLENAGEFGSSGVDRLSVGALTHSAPALDLSLRLEPLA